MTPKATSILLERLEDLAMRLNITVSYEKGLTISGGFCRVKDQKMILINKNLPLSEKIELIAGALTHFPLEDLYILPEVREYLEWYKNKMTEM